MRQCFHNITVDRTHKLLPMITNRIHLSCLLDVFVFGSFFCCYFSYVLHYIRRWFLFFASYIFISFASFMRAHTTDTRRVLKTRRSTCYPSHFTMHTCLCNAHILSILHHYLILLSVLSFHFTEDRNTHARVFFFTSFLGSFVKFAYNFFSNIVNFIHWASFRWWYSLCWFVFFVFFNFMSPGCRNDFFIFNAKKKKTKTKYKYSERKSFWGDKLHIASVSSRTV